MVGEVDRTQTILATNRCYPLLQQNSKHLAVAFGCCRECQVALGLLLSFRRCGLERLVLCPGSRSGRWPAPLGCWNGGVIYG